MPVIIIDSSAQVGYEVKYFALIMCFLFYYFYITNNANNE